MRIERDDGPNYSVKYQQASYDGEARSDATREVHLEPGEVHHMQKCMEYALPALHGWHAMYNSGVVQGGGNPFDDM